MTELASALPTAAIQAFAGEVIKVQDGAEPESPEDAARRPFQIDRCHALRSDGPAVARFYPRWYRGAPAVAPAAADAATDPHAQQYKHDNSEEEVQSR
jgi:hypothetical protein